ncbi:hypothetical protein EW145_g8355, partial [Phellinidium pouzarii]
SNGTLSVCGGGAAGAVGASCYAIAGPGARSNPFPDTSGGVVAAVDVTGLDPSDPAEVTTLSMRLHDAWRENISFLIFQIWLLGVSIVTILNESVPHLITALITHALSTMWVAFQVSRTGHFESIFKTLVVDDACGGINTMPTFWSVRLRFFIPILALNVVAFVITLVVSLRLFNVYTRQTCKRVGESSAMNRRYLFVLLFSVFLQTSVFFTLCSSALWVDTLCNGALAPFVQHKTAYRVIFIITCIIELPWLIAGWISFRREHRLWSAVFLVVGATVTIAWSTMFASSVYRWTFQNFPFFATMTVTSFVVLVITLGLGLNQKTPSTHRRSSLSPPPKARAPESRIFSIIFPDKRISVVRAAAHPDGNEDRDKRKSLSSIYRPYKRGAAHPPSEDSVIDIKAPGAPGTLESEEFTTVDVLEDPASSLRRISDVSGLGKLASSRFSAFSTFSQASS